MRRSMSGQSMKSVGSVRSMRSGISTSGSVANLLGQPDEPTAPEDLRPSMDAWAHYPLLHSSDTEYLEQMLRPLDMDRMLAQYFPSIPPAAVIVWDRLNELRRQKILLEIEVRQVTVKLADMEVLEKRGGELLKLEVTAEEDSKKSAAEATAIVEAQLQDSVVLMQLPQGQDEIYRANFGRSVQKMSTDVWTNAIMVDRHKVETQNHGINRCGRDKVSVMLEVAEFRKLINIMEWEHRYLTLRKRDLGANLVDLHMVKVTKSVQQHFASKKTENRDQTVAVFDQCMRKLAYARYAKTVHTKQLRRELKGLQQTSSGQRNENALLREQLRQLDVRVAERRRIKKSREENARIRTQKRAEQLEGMIARRQLVDRIKWHSSLLEKLQLELEELKNRTYPNFDRYRSRRDRGKVMGNPRDAVFM